MSGKPLKAVIFDMDGVLVNSEPHHIIIEKQLFAQLNLNISDEEHSSYMGKSSEQMWTEIIRKHNLSHKAEELAQRNTDKIIEYFSGLNEIDLMPGIVNLLEKISHKRIPVAVASSSDAKTIEIILSRTGLSKYFLHVISSGLVAKGKPEPDIYLYTARLLNVKPDECLVVEDSVNGIKAAKAAKMLCVAYNGVSSVGQNHDLADETINDFSQMPEILQKYFDWH
jgi:HAD superfamily hydrolase (TIGR01509 family)